MCGIYGYYNRYQKPLDSDRIDAMAEAIQHRGPDGHGRWEGKAVALGNQRLAILDPEGGDQPFFSDDGSVVVVQNGEIFNFIELAQQLRQRGIECRTKCDTEVILRLYEAYGMDFVPMLNGMFAIAIYDGRTESTYLIRDRVGEKPLYVFDDGQSVLFSSEIKSLLRAGVSNSVDHEALDQFLSFNFIPPPKTIFQSIKHVMPGHWMRLDKRGALNQRWWDLSEIDVEERSDSEWIELFNHTLEDAVRLRLRADVPFGAFLSGGVDSSSVVGLMARNLDRPVKTFCIGFNERRFDESAFALMASRRFGTDHVMQRVDENLLDSWPRALWHCDQPHGDISFLPTLRVSELAVQHVKMVLTGDGADELFAGYDKYLNFFAAPGALECSETEFRRRYYGNLSLMDTATRKGVGTHRVTEGNSSFELMNHWLDRVPHMDRINQALYLDMMMLLPGNNLVKPDRMSMAVGLETRAPFLDYRMMELAFRMPGNLKLRTGETKWIYKRAVAPLIGNELTYRKKQMFTVPVGEWLKSGLSAYSEDLLLSARVDNRGFFATEYLGKMLAAHRGGGRDYTRELRAMMAVELWGREFMDVAVARPIARTAA